MLLLLNQNFDSHLCLSYTSPPSIVCHLPFPSYRILQFFPSNVSPSWSSEYVSIRCSQIMIFGYIFTFPLFILATTSKNISHGESSASNIITSSYYSTSLLLLYGIPIFLMSYGYVLYIHFFKKIEDAKYRQFSHLISSRLSKNAGFFVLNTFAFLSNIHLNTATSQT